MKKILIAICIVIIAAFILNPGFEKHQAALSKKYKETNPITGILGVGDFLSKFVNYQNYYLCSTTKTSEEGKMLSIGIFGKVFITTNLDTKQVEDKIKKIIDN